MNSIKNIGFQWERYEAWRYHPLLKFNKREALPGIGIGFGLFVAYTIYTKATGGDDHHGSH